MDEKKDNTEEKKGMKEKLKDLSDRASVMIKDLSVRASAGFKEASERASVGFKDASEQAAAGYKDMSERAAAGYKDMSEQAAAGYKDMSEQAAAGYKDMSERASAEASKVQVASWNPIQWFKDLANRTTPDGILLFWLVIGTAIAVTLPLATFAGARAANEANGSYEAWEQRQYEAQNGYNSHNVDWYNWMDGNGKYQDFDSYNQYNKYEANNYKAYNQNQQQYENSAYDFYNNILQQNQYLQDQEALDEKKKQTCGLFYWICDVGPSVPIWWSAISEPATIDDDDEPTKLLAVLYIWALAFLLYMILVVRRIAIKAEPVSQSSGPFVMLTACSIACMFLLGGLTGAIRDDGAIVAQYGWYGQMGVLLYMTYLCSAVLGVVFFFVSQHLSGEQLYQERQQKMETQDEERRHEAIRERVKDALYPSSP